LRIASLPTTIPLAAGDHRIPPAELKSDQRRCNNGGRIANPSP
jgi:hypothetical protein